MAKEPQELKWIEELLPEDEYRRKAMFGGFAYYISEKMVLATFESTGNRTYKGKRYPYEIWNGCMFPVEKEYQERALQKFPFLVSHPILPKWLYLPLDTENFEELASDIVAQAIKPTGYWGSIPKPKKTLKKKKAVKEDEDWRKIDTRTPRMFSDEPAEDVFKKAKKISDLKNLGPQTERAFHKAGIKTVPQFLKLGWKKTMQKLVKSDPKSRHSVFAYALIGALTNKEWNAISESEKEEARNFVRSLPRK
ncbi:TfoX/Sxy family DNA transformation protein [Bdellovibrio sp. HCB337]|uniref:TfoX/Sxy family DNA transformation protein n=1 Tax=Bdellovibrio sp. HCB337 TaxID=3394358 RepID=UPI0039A52843